MILRSVMRMTNNGVVGDTFLYEASVSPELTMQIIDHVNIGTDGHLRRCWQIRPITNGKCGQWTGTFISAEEATATLPA